MYRLLAIDIDGTLVNSRNELTPDTQAALADAGKAGIRVVLATGRRYSHTLPLVEPLGIDVPLVTASGALIKDPHGHRTLYQAQFDRQTLCEMLAIVDRCGFDPVLCADTFSEGFDYYLARMDVRTPQLNQYVTMNPTSGRIWPDLIENPPPGVFSGFSVGTQEQMLHLESELKRNLDGRLHVHVLHPPKYDGFFTEMAPAGVTKWSAVQRLAQSWGIAESEICAVGDDVNDLPMIRAAGLGVAMGNALPSVKAAADRIAPTHDENGLVEVVRWLLEHPNAPKIVRKPENRKPAKTLHQPVVSDP
jgi:Cof subfamily protein (haloacid dehalogenase superfamily)